MRQIAVTGPIFPVSKNLGGPDGRGLAPAALSARAGVKYEAQKVHQNLCRQNGRRPCWIVIRRDFNQINADDIMPLGCRLQHLQHIVIEKPAMARRAGPRRNRGAEGVDVDRDVDLCSFGNMPDDTARP